MAKRKQKDVLPPDAVVTETIPKTFTVKVEFSAEELREAARVGEDIICNRLADIYIDFGLYYDGCSVVAFGQRYFASLSSATVKSIDRFYYACSSKKYNPKPLTLNLTFNLENY